MCEQPFVKQYGCADSLTFRFHRHFSLGIECDPLSRPTWVLGVILRKEAPFSLQTTV